MSAPNPSSTTTSAADAAALRKQWRKFFFFFALLLVMTGAAYWWGNRTYHFAAVDDGILYRDGNRGMTEFASAVRKSHAKTVVTLIDDDELNDANKPQFKKEAEFLTRQNVRQERIPVKLGGRP